MSNRIEIDDSWVLIRAGHSSSSFSSFLSDIVRSLPIPSTEKQQVEKGLDLVSRIASPEGLDELGVPEFAKPFATGLMEELQDTLQKEITESMRQTSMSAQARQRAKIEKTARHTQKAAERVARAEEAIEKRRGEIDARSAQLEERMKQLSERIDQKVTRRLFGRRLFDLSKALYQVAKERGIDNAGILHLIQMLPEFDALLYFLNVRKFYRDHTAHQLRVAVLGDYLLDLKSKAGELEGVVGDQLGLSKEDVRKAWWFTGLLHDVGYPLEKLYHSLNWSLVNELLRCYPSLGIKVTPMHIDLASNELENKEYLAILTQGLPKRWQSLIKGGLGVPGTTNTSTVFVPSSSRQEYKPQSAKMDHGVVAAVSLLRTLGTPERLKQRLPEDRPLIEASRAIALHNFASKLGAVTFEEHPLAFLLIVADELQEWSRPVPSTVQDSYFTTSLEKVTLLDAIFYDPATDLWDIPYANTQAKQIIRFDFKRLSTDKEKALKVLDCTEQFPESEVLLQDIQEGKPEATDKFSIPIRSR
jgi:hypothetical protein